MLTSNAVPVCKMPFRLQNALTLLYSIRRPKVHSSTRTTARNVISLLQWTWVIFSKVRGILLRVKIRASWFVGVVGNLDTSVRIAVYVYQHSRQITRMQGHLLRASLHHRLNNSSKNSSQKTCDGALVGWVFYG